MNGGSPFTIRLDLSFDESGCRGGKMQTPLQYSQATVLWLLSGLGSCVGFGFLSRIIRDSVGRKRV